MTANTARPEFFTEHRAELLAYVGYLRVQRLDLLDQDDVRRILECPQTAFALQYQNASMYLCDAIASTGEQRKICMKLAASHAREARSSATSEEELGALLHLTEAIAEVTL